MNILITSAGRRVSLVKYFMKEALEASSIDINIYTSDIAPELSSACRLSHKSFKVGKFSDSNFITDLLEICSTNGIRLIIPTIDTELLLLASNRLLFSEHNIEILVSNVPLITICRDKRLTHDYFKLKNIRIPKLIDKYSPKFPLFIKPIDGSSSQDLYVLKSEKHLSQYLIEKENLIWMEYLPSEGYTEYTIDLYYDKNSKLICSVPRVRIAVRGGETNKGITQKNVILLDFIKERLGHLEGARGCITLQLFQSNTNMMDIYGIEINPRFGGGYPLSYLAGANFPRWIIEEYLLGQEVVPFVNWKDNLLLLRYDSEMVISDYQYNK